MTDSTATTADAAPVVAAGATAATPATTASETPAKPADTRSVAQIEADIEASRARLVQRVDELKAYASPAAVKDRALRKAKRVFVDEYGGIRPERVLVAAAVVTGVVVLVVWRRRSR